MHMLIKDYKPLKGGIVRTRPVLNGNDGMNAPLNNLISGLI